MTGLGFNPEPDAFGPTLHWPDSGREREFAVVVVDRYTGVARELRVTAAGEFEAACTAGLAMTEDESIDSVTS